MHRHVPALDSAGEVAVFLVAPAGFGKTTLAAQLLQDAHHPSAWMTLEARDRQPDRFGRLLWASLQKAVPSFGNFGIENEPGLLGSPPDLAEALCFFAAETKTEKTWICFDNFEAVQEEPGCVTALRTFVEHGRERFRVIVTTRHGAGLELMTLETRGWARVVEQSELAFGREDVARLLSAAQLPDGFADPEEVLTWTDGWPVAVRLWVSMCAEGRAPARETYESKAHRFVDEALLDGFDTTTKAQMAKCSLLDTVDSFSCAGLGMKREEIEALVSLLESSRLPIEKSADGKIRFHSLLRSALTQHLRRTHDETSVAALIDGLARYYESESEVEAAMKLLCEHGHARASLELMGRHAHVLASDWAWVESWLQTIPQELRTHGVYIRVYSHLLARKGRADDVITFLARYLDRLEDPTDQFYVWIAWAMNSVYSGRVSSAELAPAVQHHVDKWRGTGFAERAGQARFALIYATAEELRLREAIGLLESEMASPDYENELAVPEDRFIHRRLLLVWRTSLGEAVDAELALLAEECAEFSDKASETRLQLADVQLLRGDLTESLQTLKARERARPDTEFHDPFDDLDTAIVKCVCEWKLGRQEDSLQELEGWSRQSRQLSRRTLVEFQFHLASLRMQMGLDPDVDAGASVDAEAARVDVGADVVGDASPGAPGPGAPSPGAPTPGAPPQNHGWLRLRYLLFLAQRDQNDGLRLTDCGHELVEMTRQSEMKPWMMTALFILSRGRFLCGDEKGSREALFEALGILDELGWRSYPGSWQALTAFTFVRAVLLGLRLETVRRLVTGEEAIPLETAFREAPMSSENLDDVALERWVDEAIALGVRGLVGTHGWDRVPEAATERYTQWSRTAPLPKLRIETFGRFGVQGPSGGIDFRRSASKRILQILLIAEGQPVPEDRLIDASWPEADLDRGRRSLQTAVNDLRKDLDDCFTPRSHSYVLYEDGCYSLSLPPGSVVDFWEFQRTASTWSRSEAKFGEFPADRLEEVVDWLALARKEFLPEAAYEDFAEATRRQIESIREHLTLSVVGALRKTSRREAAISLLRNTIAAYPLWDDGVAALVETYLSSERALAAGLVLRDYEERLLRETGLRPDPRFVDLAAEIRGQIGSQLSA